MNEAREQILAWCYQQSLHVPHIFYCTGPHRFGPYCRDCSGMTSEAYRSAGIRTGLDTGAIARDVIVDKADFASVGNAIAGDLLMRRSGSTYNGGSDEHVGIFVRNDGDYVWTWESAGSQNGHGLYRRRQTNTSKPFWRDAVRYHALNNATTPDQPTPIPPPFQEYPVMLLLDDQDPHVWIVGDTRRWAENDGIVNAWKAPQPPIVPGLGPKGEIPKITKAAMDNIPVQKGTKIPPGYVVAQWEK